MRYNKFSGFTIVETIFALFISTIVIGGAFYISATLQKGMGLQTALLEISRISAVGMHYMTRDIHWATKILSSGAGYTTSDSTLILEVPSIDASGDIIDIESDFDTIIYTLNHPPSPGNPSTLLRVVDADEAAGSSRADSTKVISTDVARLVFASEGTPLSSVSNLGGVDILDIAVTIRRTSWGFIREKTIESSATLRNY